MTKSGTQWANFFIGFAIVTIISGIYLIIQKDYVIGVGGTLTGLFLLYLNHTNKAKAKSMDNHASE